MLRTIVIYIAKRKNVRSVCFQGVEREQSRMGERVNVGRTVAYFWRAPRGGVSESIVNNGVERDDAQNHCK